MFRPFFAICLFFSIVTPAMAADTIETWDKGSGNFEVHFGADEFGCKNSDHSVCSTALMGWGLAERFSAFMATGFTSDSYLNNSEPELIFGAFGTPVDTDHLDMDLGITTIISGQGLSEPAVVPFLEINLDRAPERSPYGLYLRGTTEISGTQAKIDKPVRNVDLNLALGTYFSLNSHQQLLLEYDITIHNDPEPGKDDWEQGALALGFNTMLNDTLELITEARLNFPQDSGDYTSGYFVGIIAALE